MIRTRFRCRTRSAAPRTRRRGKSGDLLALSGSFADIGTNPEANETIVRVPARQDPPDRARPRDGRSAVPEGPLLRHQASLPRHQLLRDLQPAARASGRLAARPDPDDHRDGHRHGAGRSPFDAIVFATGFDAMTGADRRGRRPRPRRAVRSRTSGRKARKTYLGPDDAGFPNFFMITGPGSPSVLSNMAVSIEQHVDWVSACLRPHARAEARRRRADGDRGSGLGAARATTAPTSRSFRVPTSWYMGANVPGSPACFLPYVGGVDRYRKACDEVVARDYLGFAFDGPEGARCSRRRRQPAAARRRDACSEMVRGSRCRRSRPCPSPRLARLCRRVGSRIGRRAPRWARSPTATCPVRRGRWPYRLYRPGARRGRIPSSCTSTAAAGCSATSMSDDPFCRDLCVQPNAIVVSVNYRHAPEARFPAARRRRVRGRCAGSRTNASGAGRHPRDSSRCAAGAPAATSRPSSASMARDAGGPAHRWGRC